ncbi:MULE domain-containing protein [Aphis craccivora]|uniref:MULE domain-containing protein n=1 Tax=Aphis craccivora TaxID=307492 RepID=A0A6G0VQJ4_APHCR|nr:MULE domain-containing protein [Aphis craccivora]
MAFLPVDRIQESWVIVKPLFEINEDEQSLLKYLKNTYVMGKQVMKTRGRSRREPVYTTPLFPSELWSVAQRVSS